MANMEIFNHLFPIAASFSYINFENDWKYLDEYLKPQSHSYRAIVRLLFYFIDNIAIWGVGANVDAILAKIYSAMENCVNEDRTALAIRLFNNANSTYMQKFISLFLGTKTDCALPATALEMSNLLISLALNAKVKDEAISCISSFATQFLDLEIRAENAEFVVKALAIGAEHQTLLKYLRSKKFYHDAYIKQELRNPVAYALAKLDCQTVIGLLKNPIFAAKLRDPATNSLELSLAAAGSQKSANMS